MALVVGKNLAFRQLVARQKILHEISNAEK